MHFNYANTIIFIVIRRTKQKNFVLQELQTLVRIVSSLNFELVKKKSSYISLEHNKTALSLIIY